MFAFDLKPTRRFLAYIMRACPAALRKLLKHTGPAFIKGVLGRRFARDPMSETSGVPEVWHLGNPMHFAEVPSALLVGASKFTRARKNSVRAIRARPPKLPLLKVLLWEGGEASLRLVSRVKAQPIRVTTLPESQSGDAGNVRFDTNVAFYIPVLAPGRSVGDSRSLFALHPSPLAPPLVVLRGTLVNLSGVRNLFRGSASRERLQKLS